MNEAPLDRVAVPRVSIDWYRSTPWWRLASQSVTIAWRGSHLALCVLGLILTQWVTQFSFYTFGPEEIIVSESWLTPRESTYAVLPFESHLTSFGLGPSTSNSMLSDSKWYSPAPDSFISVWRRYASIPYQAIQLLTVRRAAYVLFNFIGVLAIWSFVGGCLARRSIVEMGTRISVPWKDTIALVLKRWQSIAWSITMPLGLIVLCCLIPIVIGWLSNIPVVGPWLAGILLLPGIFLFLGMGWSAAVSLFGFSLSTCAVVCEKQADAFDGLSRAAAYTFQRPLTLLLTITGAELISRFAGTLLSMVLNTGYSIFASAFEMGSFYSIHSMGTVFDPFFAMLVPMLTAAFGFSFFWTSSAAMYLLLRKDVDNAEFDLIDMGDVATSKTLTPLPDKLLPVTPPASSGSESEKQSPDAEANS